MRVMRWTLLLLCMAEVATAQQVDTTLGLRKGRAVELMGTTGTVEVRTWSRPEVRIQVRGAGASRVRVRESASRVFVEELFAFQRPDSVIWRWHDSAGMLVATVGVRTPAIQVMPGRGPMVERGTVRADTGRLPLVERGTVRADTGRLPLVERGTVRADTGRLPLVERGTVRADTGRLPVVQGNQFRSATGGWSPPAVPVPASVDYVITVPERSHVIVRGSTVDITLSGALDSLELSNVRGSIRAMNVSGHVTLTSLEGRVLVEGSAGDLFARTLSGSVVVRDAVGSVEAQGVAGSIELMDVRAARIKASTYDGGIRLQGALPPNGSIQLSTFRGPIGFPASGPCAQVLPGMTLQEIRPSSGERFDLLLITTAPPGATSGPATCALRRE